MKDSYGRTIDYMRISVTDRCNLRCKYCMPDGIESLPMKEILTFEEIREIVACGADLGIRKIKITGGEPLVRKDCCELIAMLKAVPRIEKVTITTNGVLLGQYLDALVKAGIDGINISLDTMDRKQYEAITGRDELETVLTAVRQASALPVPIKINAVSMNFGISDWQSLLRLAKEYPVDVRFIEMMPIGYGKKFETIDHKTLLEEIHQEYPQMEEDPEVHGFGPAVYYRIPGFKGSIGFISAIHGKFCQNCNRIRITSLGYLKSCLCFEDGTDLRKILRSEGRYDDCERHLYLRAAMEQAIFGKPAAHCFERPEEITEAQNMISIGG